MLRSNIDALSLLQEAGDTVRNAGKYQLDILSGCHSGASVKLDAGTVGIGSSKDNSVILFADQIAEKHASIDLPTNPLKEIRVSPVQDTIRLENGDLIEVGQYAEINSGEVFYCGEAGVCITRFADPKSVGKISMKVVAVLCILAILPLAYGLMSNFAVGVADASSNVISALNSGINSQKERLMGVEPESEKGKLESFSWTARTKLEDLKLNHRLRVSPTGTGSLRVFGSISDSELPRWTNFLQWYDANPTFPPLIRDVNRQGSNQNLPKISAVWLDDNPSAVFQDGVVATVGSELRGGWKVISIDAAAVTIERDGSIISLTY